MTNNVVETLESRRLLAVTLDNGLAPTDPGYFTVTIGNGEPTAMLVDSVNALTEYSAFLDLGADATTLDQSVVRLSDYASDAIRRGDEAVSQVLIRLKDTDDATDPLFLNNPQITGEIHASIPHGSSELVTTYSLTSFGVDLTNTRLIQYWDGASFGGEDFLLVDGSVPQRDLRLRIADTQNVNFSEQRNHEGGSFSIMSGFGADDADALLTAILAGGYDPIPAGDIVVPPGNVLGFGNGFGPAPAIGTALVYRPLASGQMAVSTSLAISPGVQGALMDVFYVSDAGEVLIPDDTTVRSVDLGTDFGASNLPYPTTHYYLIANHGMQDLALYGNPRVQVVGDSNDFVVTRQPTPFVSGGGYSYFFIQFTPTTPGIRTAKIVINSSDPTTTPYTFEVYGGSGVGIEPDIYENDGNSSDVRFRYFDKTVTPQIAKAVSVDGVWKMHTIHEPGDIDWSVFVLAEDTDVYLHTTSARGDMRMYLYDDCGNQVGYDNDSGPGSNPAMILPLGAGTYYVRVDEYGNNSTVPAYGLSVRAGHGVQVSDDPVYLDGSGKLVVRGTEFGDTITADLFDGSVRITINTSQLYFPIDEVTNIFINGRGGNDTIYVGPGVVNSDVRGSMGDDSITVETQFNVTVIGGDGNDSISGGGGNDYLVGKRGRDTIYGNAGNDYIIGSGANDMLYGGGGSDTLLGSNGDDMLDGGAGNDLISGGDGMDEIYGRGGNDTLDGEGGQDVVDSGAGFNVVSAQDGQMDTLYVSFANDVYFYDPGLDVLIDTDSLLV